jgi:hypothetical protein
MKDGKVYFFINCSDDIRRLRKDRIEFKQIGKNRANLFVIQINEAGDFDFKKLIDDKESKVSYQTINGIISTDETKVILAGSRGKDKRLIKLTF